MDDLVDKLQDTVLYMRTVELRICHDNHYIHGMRIAIRHDAWKDPRNNELLDTFYSSKDTVLADHHRKFYEHYVGSQEGVCDTVHLAKGEKIISILFKYDNVIRSVEVKKNDGSIVKLGEEDPLHHKNYETDIINFTKGEEIVGVMGMLEKDKKTAGVANHFVSMGFITNQCENTKL